MSVISTTNLRENMAKVFEAIGKGQEVVVRFGRGKNAKLVQMNLISKISQSTDLDPNHSLIKFAESDFFKNSTNTFQEIPDLKEYYNKSFIEATGKEK